MEETNVSEQISFLEVMAVHYDEKPAKDGIVIRRKEVCSETVRLNQPAGGTIDCTIHRYMIHVSAHHN